MRIRRLLSSSSGFTLVEVLVAATLLAVLSIGVVGLLGVAGTSGRAAREQTSSTILAAARMEQLRSLAWGYEKLPPPLVPRSDDSTDLSFDPPRAGGPGLSASPPGTLAANQPPYVDYLDFDGRWVGNGSQPPATAAFVRRWAVRPLPADPDRALVLQVLVLPIADGHARGRWAWQGRAGQQSLLTAVRTRRSQ
ncbi:MAG TPA: prepilin-type N-terminal cleavage/methylation domain-containing protein [Vicinamibacterales bacterium]|nr:prepilin-type N-terminal cleavage/methylation domain-containing protein [Vicinamibacterales bacterium]